MLRLFAVILFVMMWLPATAGAADEPAKPEPGKPPETPASLVSSSRRIVFLGDSITAAGGYVVHFELWLGSRREPAPRVIDAGLPSETVSGLSEEGHAGGQFPRPDLAERLDRVLAATKPDLVIACYGINCGIYQPFSESRLESWQAGLKRLRERARMAGAKTIHLTPPCYDDQRSPKGFSYNEVLGRYSKWLLGQQEQGWLVLDLHGPMTLALAERRKAEPQFTFQPDGVHPNDAGHWFIAQQLIRGCGDEGPRQAADAAEWLAKQKRPASALALAQQRVAVLRDAYVGAAGHLRPGIAKGLPLAEAEAKADELTRQIQSLAAD